jgi:SAM-dependent methyltransferase
MDDLARETLLAAGAPRSGESWLDGGCGDGAFSLPLLRRISGGGFLLAIDRDPHAISALRTSLDALCDDSLRFELRVGDVENPGSLPPLDGILLANVLHYLPDPGPALGKLASSLKAGGRILLIEYDRADANPWVPYPLPTRSLEALARTAAIPPFEVMARVRSDFGRMLYAAVSTPG